MDSNNIIQIILSSITALAAICGIFMTRHEVKAMNKQSLFNKRLENYLTCRKLYLIVTENNNLLHFSKETKGPLEVSVPFYFLSNCEYLEKSATLLIDGTNNEIRRLFHKNLEFIETIAESNKLLFSDEYSSIMGDFLYSMKDCLYSMYKYSILLDLMRDSHGSKVLHKTFDELSSDFNEKKSRRLVINSSNKLLCSARKVDKCDVLSHLYSETKLSRR